MDKTTLIEYANMREEIKDLRRRVDDKEREIRKIQKAMDKLSRIVVSDTVTCGRKGKKPLGVAVITGTPYRELENKRESLGKKQEALEKNKRMLEESEIKLLEMQNQAEEYIQSLKRSELRTMFRLYFIDDLSYPKVALQMNDKFPDRNIKYTDENIKKRIQRFFENVPQCPD